MAESHELNLQHHYRDMAQQHDAAKLGIWLFLATEVLLFGGLFCGYAIFRGNNPELFKWGEQFLDEFWGGLNTAVLLISSLTMAMAITYVQLERKRAAMISLTVTLLCACGFMVIKSIEYSHKFHDHLLGGLAFYQVSEHGEGHGEPTVTLEPGDASAGKKWWDAACRSCHGPQGEGVPGQGTALNTSPYVHNHTDAELVHFIEEGRTANDEASITKLEMPAKGGNPMLKEQDLYDVVAYLRTLQTEPVEVNAHQTADVQTATAAPSTGVIIDDLPRSTVPLANHAPSGLAPVDDTEAETMAVFLPAKPHEKPKVPQLAKDRPANAHLFFGLYFMMTGLHGIHVLIGMLVILWIMWRLQRGDFNKRYYAAVECGGLYWHIVDVIWIFLFPLWYLI
ncbi:MAG: cytochrome c oxidase subunit 3 [Planctomycetota bacterium]|nr:cytochrome c oxidase subunit 3 [Planctomycetota bacterium]